MPKGAFYFRIFLIMLLQTIAGIAFTQTKMIDSLKRQITNTKNDEERFALIINLCSQYRSMHPDTLRRYVAMAKKITAATGNAVDIAGTEYYEAVLLNRFGKTDSALAIVEKNLQLPGDQAFLQIRNNFAVLKGNLLVRNNKQAEAIESCLLLLHLADSTNNAALAIKAKTILGWANMELGKNRESLNWSLDAINTWKKSDTTILIAVVYCNTAAVYNELKKNDSAEIYIVKGIAQAQKEQNLTSLTNGYYIYSDICVALGNISKAESLLKEGLKIRRQIGDQYYIISDIAQLGVFYANNNQPQKGIDAVKEGITIAEQNNLYAKLPFLYSALAKNYKAANDMVNYTNTLNKIIELKDTLYAKNSAEALAEMQTKYDVQKKETTIIQQQYDLTKKNYFIYSIVAVLAATLLFSFFFFQNRRKNQRLKIQVMETEQKKKTTQAVMQAEEEERKRIAGDLHDSVAQKMVVAKLNLEALGNQLKELNEPQQKIYSNISTLLEESNTEVRNLSHSMMPRAFTRSGLTSAVKDFLEKIEKPGLKINFSTHGDFTNIKENTALMVYRIIQECVQNVLKHAKATNLDVSMIAENNEMDVTIEDNGVGFDLNTINEESTGLKNIRSRIEYLSGKLDINSKPGNGTVTAFYIPLEQV